MPATHQGCGHSCCTGQELHLGLDYVAAVGVRLARHDVVNVDVIVVRRAYMLHAEIAVAILIGIIPDVMMHVVAAVHIMHMVEFEAVRTSADWRALVGKGQAGEDEREGRDKSQDK
jgi:hypothetical protein